MVDSKLSQQAIDIESTLLRFLCSGEGATAWREQIRSELHGYGWTTPEHRVLYDAIGSIRNQDPISLREQLPSQATRMGFPDIDWAHYLKSPELSERHIEAMVRELIPHPPKDS